MIEELMKVSDTFYREKQMSLRTISEIMELPHGSFMRWRSRLKKALEIIYPRGPRKVPPIESDMQVVSEAVRKLDYSNKRSFGANALYQSYKNKFSRRDFAFLVKQARFDAQVEHRKNLRRVSWKNPGVTWAFDETELISGCQEGKIKILTMRDLSTAYKFPPIEGLSLCGPEIAEYLRKQFSRFGPPLFLKRDNGSALNHHKVNEVLEEFFVIPLNSPVYYPPYNGAVEHDQSEIKDKLKSDLLNKEIPVKHFNAYARAAFHDLNHKPKRSLNGKTSCNLFFNGKEKYKYSKRTRKDVFDWIKNMAAKLLEEIKNKTERAIASAWRIAIESWLRENRHIEISINGKVLPYLSPILVHQ